MTNPSGAGSATGKADPRADTGKMHNTKLSSGERISYNCPVCFDSGCQTCGVERAYDVQDREPVRNAWPMEDCPPLTDDEKAELNQQIALDEVAQKLSKARVTPDDIDMAIDLAKQVYYHRVPHTTTVICAVTLSNGFTVIGASSSISDAHFSLAIGYGLALNKVKDKLWEFRCHSADLILGYLPRKNNIPGKI